MATTMGTGPAPVGPESCSAHHRITPSAAASPNAEPPLSTTASRRSTIRSGDEQIKLTHSRRAASHLARRNRAVGKRITVQPVWASGCVRCPSADPRRR